MTSDAGVTVDAAATALVVVDMQNDFCHPDGYYAHAGRDIAPLAAAIAPTRALLQRGRHAGLTVVFTRLVHDMQRGAMEERHVIRPRRWTASGKRLLPGSWGAEVIADLEPEDGEIVVDKTGYSAFDDTTLERDLRARGITTLILSGVVTYACVLATAFSAFDRGFDVLLATEAVGSWNAALGSGTTEIVDLLLGRAVAGDDITITPRPSR
jgi:nicotinamidase-related amidase